MGRQYFVFLFRQGTEQPHQGDVNNKMPFLIHQKRYAIRTYQSRLTDAPRHPPKTTVTPRRWRGAGMTTVPDDDVTAAAVSRDAVATNATNVIGPRGARDLRAGAETETW